MYNNNMLVNPELTSEQFDEIVETWREFEAAIENVMEQIRAIMEPFFDALMVLYEQLTRTIFISRLIQIGAPYWLAKIVAYKTPYRFLPRGWIWRELLATINLTID